MPRTKKNTSQNPTIALDNAVVDTEDPGVITPPAPSEASLQGEPPSPIDPGWNDYVLSQFDPEKDFDDKGRPLTDACRVVVEKLLGPIIAVRPVHVFEPTQHNMYRATVAVEVAIAFGGDRNDVRIFGDLADIYEGNSGKYAQFASATAFTRAEGRCYRKALMLRGIYTAEEVTDVPATEAGLNGFITLPQRRFIDKLCREMDINVLKFINLGGYKYSKITDIRNTKAKEMIECLNGYQADEDKIPLNIRGYDANWNASQS